MSIGHKAMMAVAKAMAATAADLFTKPEKLQAIQAEFRERTQGFQYECLVPADVEPLEELSPPYEFTSRSAG
jgi:aminobenzoyl-glutamate utilization protein B